MSFKEIQFPLNPLTLAAKAWGPKNGYPVLALHGWMDNANSFDRLAPLLTDIRLVALDLPGHGRSEHRASPMPYYVWEYGLDVLDVVDALGWETFGLLGHSLGGGVATLVAGMVPERVDRLVLIESVGPLAGSEEEMPASLLKARRAVQTLADAQSRRAERQEAERGSSPRFRHTDEAVERRLLSPLTLPKSAIKILIERGTHAVDGGFDWSHDPRLILPTAVRMTEAQIQTHIKLIEAPTDLILGDAGLFMDEERASFVQERLPLFRRLTRHLLSGGHHLHMDGDAEPIARIMMNTFKK